jgi:hypothetical protein
MTLGGFRTSGARALAFLMTGNVASGWCSGALAEMRAAIEDVNAISVLVELEPSAFEDFLNDEFPNEGYWDEKLSLARAR